MICLTKGDTYLTFLPIVGTIMGETSVGTYFSFATAYSINDGV